MNTSILGYYYKCLNQSKIVQSAIITRTTGGTLISKLHEFDLVSFSCSIVGVWFK